MDLSGTYGDRNATLHGVIGSIDDAVSNNGTAAQATHEETSANGARLAQRNGKRANYIIGPNGDVVTAADLPSPGTTRWVVRRKAEVVFAVHAGLLTLEEACTRYSLTADEFHSWQIAIERHGLLALRTTQLQQYRHGEGEPGTPKGWHAPRPSEADRFVFTADDVS